MDMISGNIYSHFDLKTFCYRVFFFFDKYSVIEFSMDHAAID